MAQENTAVNTSVNKECYSEKAVICSVLNDKASNKQDTYKIFSPLNLFLKLLLQLRLQLLNYLCSSITNKYRQFSMYSFTVKITTAFKTKVLNVPQHYYNFF